MATTMQLSYAVQELLSILLIDSKSADVPLQLDMLLASVKGLL